MGGSDGRNSVAPKIYRSRIPAPRASGASYSIHRGVAAPSLLILSEFVKVHPTESGNEVASAAHSRAEFSTASLSRGCGHLRRPYPGL